MSPEAKTQPPDTMINSAAVGLAPTVSAGAEAPVPDTMINSATVGLGPAVSAGAEAPAPAGGRR